MTHVPPAASDRDSHTALPLSALVARCQDERHAFQSGGPSPSPACVELFRRAFSGDDEAWTAVRTVFERQMRIWIGSQQAVDPDDVVQEAFLAFFRAAPRQASLVATDQLGPVLLYLRQCTKTAVLQILRRDRTRAAGHPSQAVALDPAIPLPEPLALADDAELRLLVRERLHALVESQEERVVLLWRFVFQAKPQEILAAHSHLFADIGAVYTVIQRLLRRLSKDAVLHDLHGRGERARQKLDPNASLEIRGHDDVESQEPMRGPCALEEAVLLDYVTGVATPELRRAVERSPACLEAAEQLQAAIEPLLRLVYRAACPDPATLVAYQEQRLAGNDQLVLRAHVAGCPHCQEEYALLAAIDASPQPAGSLVRRLVEAIFQPPEALPEPARGSVFHYRTPQLAINLSMRQHGGGARTWTLRGQARTAEGLQADGIVEAVTLRDLGQEPSGEREGALKAGGIFVFDNLPDGVYKLHLLTSEEEIVIRRIVVGDGE